MVTWFAPALSISFTYFCIIGYLFNARFVHFFQIIVNQWLLVLHTPCLFLSKTWNCKACFGMNFKIHGFSSRVNNLKFMNSRFQTWNLTISNSWVHDFNYTNSRFQFNKSGIWKWSWNAHHRCFVRLRQEKTWNVFVSWSYSESFQVSISTIPILI
jgi:hypothetical protein